MNTLRNEIEERGFTELDVWMGMMSETIKIMANAVKIEDIRDYINRMLEDIYKSAEELSHVQV